MTAPAEIQALGAPETECNHAAPAPVLISVQQVAFSTAAVMPVRTTTLRRWAGTPSVILGAIRNILQTSSSEQRAPHRDVPRRYSYLEYGCMSREMDRL